MTHIERSVYNIFHFVRDIGGLVSGLNGLFSVIIALIHYQDLHYYLVSKLYQKEQLKVTDDMDFDKTYINDSGTLDKSKASTLKLNFLLFFSKCCPFLKSSNEEKYFLQGLKRYKQDIDIVEFFRTFGKVKSLLESIKKEVTD